MATTIRYGETNAVAKTVYFTVYDDAGRIASGEAAGITAGWACALLTGLGAINLAYQNNHGSDVHADGVFGHAGQGEYYYVFDDAEVGGLAVVGTVAVKFGLAGYRTTVVRIPLFEAAVESPPLSMSGPFHTALGVGVLIVVWVPTATAADTDFVVQIRKPGDTADAVYDGTDLGGGVNWVAENGDGCWLEIMVPSDYTDVAGWVTVNVLLDEIPHINAQAIVGAGASAGAIDVNSFSTDAQRLLFRLIFNGLLISFDTAEAVLDSEIEFDDHVLRGTLLHLWSGTGRGQSWIIADNIGNVCTLVGGDAWPVSPDLPTSKVAIYAFGDSLGTLFNQGGAERTNGRQINKAVGAALLNTGGVNIGQPNQLANAVVKDEAGDVILTSDVPRATGSKTTAWVKGAP